MRLTGPRTPGAPAHATAPAETIAELTELLADRTVLIWTESDLTPLHDALRHLKLNVGPLLPAGHGRVRHLRHAAAQWRADLDPTTGELRFPTPPGTADRLLYLLRRMAKLDSVGDLGVIRRGGMINGHARGCSKTDAVVEVPVVAPCPFW
ncbi:hypothetical protein [Kitasatospora aureofaciens]|uniref:hypothetical protein n=1 Tax=Kitasatospora aureofaciens TaxID=1894 RepID=UPI001C45750D|nr:hypothetical protein [Kitasatospora aureofaciens]MBV6703456.1 hypothetical protein [Kitasatospora aureofaciens]